MNQTHIRYHALDAMRASMMLLGIYLHVVLGYANIGHWAFIESHPSRVLLPSLVFIHAFRMPAFFAMAGFFGALLWTQRGPAAFVSNRARRVLLPFVLFWIVIYALMTALGVVRVFGIRQLPHAFLSAIASRHPRPMYLWFLEYLALLYVVCGVVAWSAEWWPTRWKDRLHNAFRWALKQPFAPALFALFLWAQLVRMNGTLNDTSGFLPEPLILLAHLPPFCFGWLLYTNRDLLDRFRRHVWIYLALAVPSFFIYGLAPSGGHPYLKAAGNVLLCWLCIFAITGLFLKYCSAASPRWRYMSDSSYWLFIMHMPVVVGLQVALMPLPMPTLPKVPIVLALSVVLLVMSYDLLVRPTWIGALLNGRRYPRRLPEVPPQPALEAAG